jgi:hypothetical protein
LITKNKPRAEAQRAQRRRIHIQGPNNWRHIVKAFGRIHIREIREIRGQPLYFGYGSAALRLGGIAPLR